MVLILQLLVEIVPVFWKFNRVEDIVVIQLLISGDTPKQQFIFKLKASTIILDQKLRDPVNHGGLLVAVDVFVD